MLTLNQKLPGERTAYKKKVQHRVYRPGELPAWLKKSQKSKKDPQNELKNTSKMQKNSITAPKIISSKLLPKNLSNAASKASKTTQKLQKMPQKSLKIPEKLPNRISESESEESLDLATLDLDSLTLQHAENSSTNSSKNHSKKSAEKSKKRRNALKNSLLKNLQIKENLNRIRNQISKNNQNQSLDKSLNQNDNKNLNQNDNKSLNQDLKNELNDSESEIEEYSSSNEIENTIMAQKLTGEKPKFIPQNLISKNLNKSSSLDSNKSLNDKYGNFEKNDEIKNNKSLSSNKSSSLSLNQGLKEKQNENALQLKQSENGIKNEKSREESLRLMVEISRREIADQRRERDAAVAELPDDFDDFDEEAEFEKWKIRELRRMQNAAEERVRFENEREEVKLRQKMTEEQRERDNKIFGSKRYEKSDAKMRFLQKYYHKGAFFQDETLIPKKMMTRDFTAPVGEDSFTDKTLLPRVLQVKDFGLMSRTKYTHLVDQDTTYGENNSQIKSSSQQQISGIESDPIMGDFRNPINPWIDFKSSNSKRFRKIGGSGGFERPSKKIK